VARQLELISELQSPTQRNSMMAVSAARDSTAAAAAGLRASHSRIPSFSAALSAQSVEALRASLTGEMVGAQQAVGAVPLSRSSTLTSAAAAGPTAGSAAAAAASAQFLRNSGFGSSFSSASFAGGLLGGGGGGVSASAPNSPQLWDKSGGGGGQGGSTPVVVPHRSAFTPGPGLTGMGDATPGGINTPR
jgi:hypothetical protein